jgi:hypothetical protein
MFCVSTILAQEETEAYGDNIYLVEFNFGYTLPLADLNDRFGGFNSVGSSVGLLLKNNVQLEVRGNLLFGNRVKEDVLFNLRNDVGIITGVLGNEAMVLLRKRGGKIGTRINKVFTTKEDSRSGLKLGIGAGLLYHRIRVQDDSRSAEQINGAYEFGYDRLSSGLFLDQFIGYQFVAKDQRLNFVLGVDVFQAMTKNRRSFDFSGDPDVLTEDRLDIGLGFKAGFMLSFYQFNQPEEIFY